MKLILFVGSGISRPSGLPGVEELTSRLLNDKWFQHTNSRFYCGNQGTARFNDPTQILQEFLKMLKPLAAQCHPRSGQKGNYEDLHFLAEQIADAARGEVDNPAIHPFVLALKAQAKPLTDKLHQPLGEIANLACEFIRCAVQQMLSYPSTIEGLHLVESLARSPDFQRVDIVTLNHDLLIERFLEQKGIQFVDGFRPPVGAVRYFDPNLFESATKVRLFKLHGSIDWCRLRGERGNPFSDRFGIVVGPDVEDVRDEQGKLLDNIDTIPWILAGTHTKEVQYGSGIYAEMHFWFHRLLKEHTNMAMSGYGWGDRGINSRLIGWLHSPQNRRLVLMHQNLDGLIADSRRSFFFRYEPLVDAGRIIPIQKWMQHAGFEEVRTRLLSSPG
jgi:SIR2-like domain